ncbi:MAG: 4Fe-4S binding protein [Candidatus Omnitrophica bacterium]|nr:4Fe-4S binding protein [Candidatus Omnitrophota bacterium]MBU1870068.1 4Fe-4S binding protein [Candidatus Omnitrophota bacterium]
MKPGRMLYQVLSSLFKKTATLDYPHDKSQKIKGFRGRLKAYPQRCIGCKMCMRDCPSQAIIIKEVGSKQFEAQIDLSKCIYCGQCADVCPKMALEITDEFELAQFDPEKLKIVFHVELKKNT